jgi:hypothetical protein
MTIEAQHPRWREQLVKLFGQGKSQGGGPMTVLDDVMPIFSLTDPEQQESHRSRQERTWGYGQSIAPVAAQGPTLSIFNSSTPDKPELLVVEYLALTCTAASTVIATVGYGAQPFLAINDNALVTDGRWAIDATQGGNRTHNPAIFFGAAGVTLTVPGTYCLVTGTGGPPSVLIEPPRAAVLKPGQALNLQGTVVNNGMVLQAFGYTRPAELSEF